MYNQIASNKRKTALLVLLFFIFIVVLGWWASLYFENGQSILLFAVLFATAMSLVSYYQGDTIALRVAGAKPITQHDNPYVYRLVENLCITVGMPVPKIYVINDPALNAFATGRDPQHASIALTTGIINALENEELEGVIAHELSHIKNYDIRLMTVVIVCVGIVALIADYTTRSFFWGGMRRRNDSNRGGIEGILLLLGLLFAILAPLAAQLIQFAVSRKREFLADASGALTTRYPEGLARALEKIAASPPLRTANRATAHLYIANPFGANFGKRVLNIFSTHPPLEERIKRLRQP